MRVFTSTERLANHLKINEIGEVGKLVTKLRWMLRKLESWRKERDGWVQNWKHWSRWKIGEKDRDECPQAGRMVKKVETGGVKVGELVKKIQMSESRVGTVGRSVRCGQEEYMKHEQEAMLAEAGEEDGFIKIRQVLCRHHWKGAALASCEASAKKS